MRQKGLFACPKRLASAYQHIRSLAAEPNNCSATHNGLATAFSISSDFWLQPFVINQWHLYFHLQNCERTFQIYISLAGMIIIKKKRPKQTDDLFHASEKLSFLLTFLNAFI